MGAEYSRLADSLQTAISWAGLILGRHCSEELSRWIQSTFQIDFQKTELKNAVIAGEFNPQGTDGF